MGWFTFSYPRWNVPSSTITISCRHVIFKYIFTHLPAVPSKLIIGTMSSAVLIATRLKIKVAGSIKKRRRIFFGTTRRRPSMGDSRGFFAHGLVTGSITFFVLGVVASMISSTFFVKETTNITKQESIRILVRWFKSWNFVPIFPFFCWGARVRLVAFVHPSMNWQYVYVPRGYTRYLIAG